MEKITFITGNAHKAQYLSTYFHIPIDHVKLDLPEIQSLSLKEVVEDKAQRAFEVVKAPVLVEDAALTFHALNALPGPLIKWFYQSLGNDGLCRLLDAYNDRSATATVAFSLCDGNTTYTVEHSVHGTVAHTPRGELGFGWDPVFVPNGHTKTSAEMTDYERHWTSMRRNAIEKLYIYLNGPTLHEMRLQENPFESIKRGDKVIEIRVNDEKRQKVRAGDRIHFSRIDQGSESLTVEVVETLWFPTFDSLFKALPPGEYSSGEASKMYDYYTPEEEQGYGVLAIRIKVIPTIAT